jgi:hypothetical protein
MNPSKTLPCSLYAGAFAFLLGATFGLSAIAADQKLFRQGMWKVDSTMEIGGKQLKNSATSCSDPNIELGDFLVPGKTPFGCSWGAPVKTGNQYKISEVCSGAISGHKNIVLTVQNDGAYTQTTEEALGKATSKTTAVATRVGDCRR